MLRSRVCLLVALALLTGCQEEKDAYDARRLEYADVQFVIEHDRYRYTIRVFSERDTSVIRIRTSGDIEEIEGQWSSKMFDEERNQWSDSLEKAKRLYWFDGIGMLKSSESILLVCDTVYQRHRMWIDFITHHGRDWQKEFTRESKRLDAEDAKSKKENE